MTAERPRDALGRPLAANADPSVIAEAVVDVTDRTDEQVWATAIDYVDRGLPFHAHEVFEQRWRSCTVEHRSAWRALAQWGAALTHAARGNRMGASRLAERAQETLDAAPSVPTVIDVERVRVSCTRLIDTKGTDATD